MSSLLLNHKTLNFEIILVSDKSAEGTQFRKGFGGIGGILRYKMDNILLNRDFEQDG